MRKNSILLLALLFLAQFAIVRAQDENAAEMSLVKGTEPAAFQRQAENGDKCLVFGKYTVKTIASEAVGEDIKIFRRAASADAEAACDSRGAAYFTMKNADANYFAGLFGEYVFVDSGTGADGRGLEIFNLKSKKSIYLTEYYGELELQEGRFFIYDKYSETKGALKNCRQAAQWKKDGFGVGWVRQSKLDLQTMKETPIGAIRCRAFQ